MTDAPTIHDAAIASADILQRDSSMFAQMLKTHQQIRAAEMEAGGFVKGCQDGEHSRPWLVVRGISDFGDSFKNDIFHHLAAHSAAVFTVDFVKRGIDIVVADPKRARRRASATPAALVVTDFTARMSQTVADLQGGGPPPDGSAAASAKAPEDGVDEVHAIFLRLKEAWRELPRRELLDQLQGLPAHPRWSQTPSASQAEILRFIGYASLTSDKNRAAEFRSEADGLTAPRLDDAVHLRWVLEADGPNELLSHLTKIVDAELWDLRLLALQRLRRYADLASDFEHPPAGITPDPESWRLYAWGLLELGRFEESLTAANRAATDQPNGLGNRVVQAVAKYFSTIIPDYARRLRRDIPEPTNIAYLRVDAAALTTLREAEATFRELVTSGLANDGFVEALEGWRLACLCGDPKRQSEARKFCGELLSRQPPHPVAIPWAMARGYDAELDAASPSQKEVQV